MLGAAAAARLGIDQLWPGERIRVGNRWFYLAGILHPAASPPRLDSAVLVGVPAARKYLGFDGHPSEIYLRADTDRVGAVHAVLAATANPESPDQVDVARPSDALVARAQAKSALNGLFLGLGAVSLLVGAVGVANTMIISVLERRSEIGLRRALGAAKGHIRLQFLSEAMLLAALGGAGRHRRRRCRHRRLRAHPALGDRHPDARLGRRHRRRHPDRRCRRTAARPARRPHVPDPGAVDAVSR